MYLHVFYMYCVLFTYIYMYSHVCTCIYMHSNYMYLYVFTGIYMYLHIHVDYLDLQKLQDCQDLPEFSDARA